jgi:hypothetical protein
MLCVACMCGQDDGSSEQDRIDPRAGVWSGGGFGGDGEEIDSETRRVACASDA